MALVSETIFTFVIWLISCCCQQISQNNKGCLEINIGTGKGASVLEMVEAFEKANKIKIPYKIEARRQW